MPEESGSRLRAAIRVLLLLALSVASLVAGALVASSLDGVLRMTAALAGFGGYLLLFAAALGKLPVDWNIWLDRSLEGFRSPAGRSPAVRERTA